jgi:hypothetical protein
MFLFQIFRQLGYAFGAFTTLKLYVWLGVERKLHQRVVLEVVRLIIR